MPRKRAVTGINPRMTNSQKEFERLHHEGAQQFGWSWLDANRSIMRVLRERGVDPEVHRALASALAFELCRQLRKPGNVIIVEPPKEG